jgi:hypothetical protein
MMKKIASHLYCNLAGIEPEPEPSIESDAVLQAMSCIQANDGLLGPTPINLESLKASPEVYIRFAHTFLMSTAIPWLIPMIISGLLLLVLIRGSDTLVSLINP